MMEVGRIVPNPPELGMLLRGAWRAQLIFSLAVQPPPKCAVLEGPRTLPCMIHIIQCIQNLCVLGVTVRGKPRVEWVSHGGTENTENTEGWWGI
jgi:hypothetical protein